MKHNPQQPSAFTLLELLVVLVVIGVLIFLSIPAVSSGPGGGQMTGTLSNARQLHLAIQTMTLDTQNVGGDGISWTSQVSKGKTTRPATVAEIFQSLTDNNYLSKSDLKKLITAPGKGPGFSDPTAANSAFKFFQVEEASPSDQAFVITANWNDKHLTSDAPYGNKGFVIFAKGGSGGIYRRLTDAGSVTLFPTKNEDGKVPYRSNALE